MMMIKKVLTTSILLLFVYPVFNQELSEMQSSKPNVVLIVSHGHGSGDLGCYGNSTIKTPNLDRLAESGTILMNGHATASSGSVSHSVILTGLFSHYTGQYGQSEGLSHFSMFSEIKGLPSYLKTAGYKTAVVGVFPLNNTIPFDTILGSAASARNTYDMAERCKQLVSTKTQPFFLYFCPADPFRSNESNEDNSTPTNIFGNCNECYPGIIPTFYKPNKIAVPGYLPDALECRKEMAQYAQAISRMDLGIGHLFELLKSSGNWDNTLIIYLSDSGAAFPGAQSTLYEPGIKLPCVIKPPFEEPRVKTCNNLISWVDVAPTILDYCHALPAEYTFHGISFKEALDQKNIEEHEEIFGSHTFYDITRYYPMRMVMNHRYKLIWNIAWNLTYPLPNDLINSATWQEALLSDAGMYGKRAIKDVLHRSEYELYDIINDPYEIKNLASNPEYSGILSDLKAKLKSFQVKTDDPWITKWNE